MTTKPVGLYFRAVGVAGALAVSLAAAPTPALAAVVPPMRTAVSSDGSTWTVCGVGEAISGQITWVLTVTGMRSNGNPILATASGSGWTFSECVHFTEEGAPAGAFEAHFTCVAAGPDVVGSFPGGGTWAPGVADQAFGTSRW